MSCNRISAEKYKNHNHFMGSLYSASPYVPIDYAIPMARMEKTVENLHPTAIITDTGRQGKTWESLNLTQILIFDELADGQADDAVVDVAGRCVCDLDLRILCTHQAQQVCRKALQFQTEVL